MPHTLQSMKQASLRHMPLKVPLKDVYCILSTNDPKDAAPPWFGPALAQALAPVTQLVRDVAITATQACARRASLYRVHVHNWGRHTICSVLMVGSASTKLCYLSMDRYQPIPP
jgi:hypothetical protein